MSCFENNIDDSPIYFICDKCGGKIFSDGVGINESGDGGIEASYKGKICDSCYALGICNNCGEYDKHDLIEIDDKYICRYCFSTLMNATFNNIKRGLTELKEGISGASINACLSSKDVQLKTIEDIESELSNIKL